MTPLSELLPLIVRLAEEDTENPSLADLAAADGRSRCHLQRVFRDTLGESPLQFTRRIRLQRAAASLLVTDKSVLEIALDAGFDSHEGFSRAFRARFSAAPREFRTLHRPAEGSPNGNDTHHNYEHLEIARRAAPCVGLYRSALQSRSNGPTGGSDMTYEVTKKQLTETPFLFIRRQVEPETISDALGAMFGPVFQYATTNGIAFAGPPTARYPKFGPGLITIEAGMPVAGPAQGEGEIQLGSLVGGDVATTVHKGPYDQLSKGHQAIEKWIAENAEEGAGAPWEAYVTDPGEVPDPAEWLTEINWPLK